MLGRNTCSVVRITDIQFGFPLSIHGCSEFHNADICNHHTAVQFPDDIIKYLTKELTLGAMLGSSDAINHTKFHCSPLMTHLKEVDSRRVILDLSYPKGNSLNDYVTRDSFDGTLFALKLSSIDGITENIINTENDPVLFSVDVARTFRNLPVDPADSLKFGIKWINQYFLDKSVVFSWVYGKASFQLISDAIAYFMRDRVQLIYIDDYITVSPRFKADTVFQNLCTLLNELSLSLTSTNLTPPTKRIPYLGMM